MRSVPLSRPIGMFLLLASISARVCGADAHAVTGPSTKPMPLDSVAIQQFGTIVGGENPGRSIVVAEVVKTDQPTAAAVATGQATSPGGEIPDTSRLPVSGVDLKVRRLVWGPATSSTIHVDNTAFKNVGSDDYLLTSSMRVGQVWIIGVDNATETVLALASQTASFRLRSTDDPVLDIVSRYNDLRHIQPEALRLVTAQTRLAAVPSTEAQQVASLVTMADCLDQLRATDRPAEIRTSNAVQLDLATMRLHTSNRELGRWAMNMIGTTADDLSDHRIIPSPSSAVLLGFLIDVVMHSRDYDIVGDAARQLYYVQLALGGRRGHEYYAPVYDVLRGREMADMGKPLAGFSSGYDKPLGWTLARRGTPTDVAVNNLKLINIWPGHTSGVRFVPTPMPTVRDPKLMREIEAAAANY